MSTHSRSTPMMLGFLAGIGLLSALPRAAFPAAADGDSLVLKALASQGALKLGEPVDIALEIELPAGATVHFPGAGVDLGAFELRDERQADPETLPTGLVRHQKVLTVTTFTSDSTSVTLPSLTAEVTIPGQGERVARTAPLVLGFTSVLPAADAGGDTADLKPLKAVIELPGGGLPWQLWLALAAVALAIVAYYLWWRHKRRRLPISALRPVDTRPCDVIALAALDELRTAGLARRGAMKEHYGRLTDILRPYLERRFGFPAIDLTTTEILAAATPVLTALDPERPRAIQDELAGILAGADLVKFAKLEPPVAIAEGEIERAADFVRATAPSRLPSPLPEKSDAEPGDPAAAGAALAEAPR